MMILQQTRGALSSGDQLALDLPFAATKSLAARIGPTPTFTRGSGATYVGSDGLLHGVDTSTTSNSISLGSKTFTLAATAGQDQLWRTGDVVDASNGSNSMVGTVTSYTPSTQVLVCNITSVTGSGTFTSWRIGYRGPRFDHNPANPTICRGLLIEDGRTNLLPRSEAFDDSAVWTQIRLVSQPVANTHIAPDGTLTAEKLIPSATTGDHRIDRSSVSGLVTGTIYTISVFVKADGYTGFGINLGSSPTPIGATFDLTNGSVSATQTGWTASVQAYPNGWYRCSATFTHSTGNRLYLCVGATGTSFSYVGDDTRGILIWGAQLEAGSFATSYIPTTTSALSRAAETCSITGASSTFGNTDGTLFTIGASLFISSTQSNNICSIDSGTTGQLRIFNRAAQAGRLSTMVSNVILTPAANYNTAGVFYKAAITANASGADYVIDGTQIPDTYTGSSITADNLKITGAGGTTTNSWISSIQYYKKRLPVSKLQALTA